MSGTERELDLGDVSKALVQIEFNRPVGGDDGSEDAADAGPESENN